MLKRAPTMPARRRHRQQGSRAVPARCTQCGISAVMQVRRVRRKTGSVTWYTWQVECWQCGNGWSPGYPLVEPE